VKFCEECKDKICLKKKKPCRKVERYMLSLGIRGRGWIRKKNRDDKISERPFSSMSEKWQYKQGLIERYNDGKT